MPAPLVSVIIACRNPGPRLREALESVWRQNGPKTEIVVVDGASDDGTREWLEARRAQLGALISEPDEGIYDALNKGVAAARGDWLLFLGADDRLPEGVFAGVAPVLTRTAAGVVTGEAAYDDGRIYRLRIQDAVRRNFVHHQGAFYRRALFAAHGRFDTALPTKADYEFNLRLLKAGVSFQAVAARIAVCGSGGLSDSGTWSSYREEMTVRHRHFPPWQCWLWDLASMIRWGRKQLLHRAKPGSTISRT